MKCIAGFDGAVVIGAKPSFGLAAVGWWNDHIFVPLMNDI